MRKLRSSGTPHVSGMTDVTSLSTRQYVAPVASHGQWRAVYVVLVSARRWYFTPRKLWLLECLPKCTVSSCKDRFPWVCSRLSLTTVNCFELGSYSSWTTGDPLSGHSLEYPGAPMAVCVRRNEINITNQVMITHVMLCDEKLSMINDTIHWGNDSASVVVSFPLHYSLPP